MAGYKVYGTTRRGAHAGHRSFEMLSVDVTSDESVENAVKEVMRLDGRIDLLDKMFRSSSCARHSRTPSPAGRREK